MIHYDFKPSKLEANGNGSYPYPYSEGNQKEPM